MRQPSSQARVIARRWRSVAFCGWLGVLLLVTGAYPSVAGVGPRFTVRLDLRNEQECAAVTALGLEAFDRQENSFLVTVDGADLVRLDSVGICYEEIAGEEESPDQVAVSAQNPAVPPVSFRFTPSLSWANPAGFADDPLIDSLLARVSSDSLVAYAQRLEAFQSRFIFSDSIVAVRDWLKAKFLAFGYSDVQVDSFYVNDLLFHPQGGEGYNIVCTKPGTVESGEVVVVGAYYDSRVTDGTDNMVWAPGGDRNASGVAVLLEIARAMRNLTTRKTVMFAALGGGEQGAMGSAYLAQQFYYSTVSQVDMMINLEAIGFTLSGHPYVDVSAWETSMGYARLATLMGFEHTWLKPRILEDPREAGWRPFGSMGYNWIDIGEGETNPAHNTAEDLVAFLDPDYWGEVTKMAALTAYAVAATPSGLDSLSARDVGDGASIELRWKALPGGDITGYRLYTGTISGELRFLRDVEGAGTTRAVVGGLTEGQQYYLSATGLAEGGHESSVRPEVTMTPQRLPRTPASVRAVAGFRKISVVWNSPVELDIDHYVIYRGTDSVYLQLYDPDWPSGTYTDSSRNVEDRVRYYYSVASVDRDGNRSEFSPVVSARAAVFDDGILIVDAGRGVASDPTAPDRMVFYQNVFSDWIHEYYHPLTTARPVDRSDLGQYRTVIWVDDGAGRPQWPLDYWADLNWYLSFNNNNILIAGWQVIPELADCRTTCDQSSGDFLYDWLNVVNVYPLNPIDCLGGVGVAGFPSVVFDTAKVPEGWDGCLGFLWGFKGGPDATIMLGYNSATGDSARQFNPVGMRRRIGSRKVAAVSLPLYYLREADAVSLATAVINWFGNREELAGDLDGTTVIDVTDVALMIDALYRGYVPIGGHDQADLNGDCRTDLLDAVILINHVFYNTGTLTAGCEP